MKINRAVARALDILNLVAEKSKLYTITELSKELEIPKTTTFEIVYTLVDKGYLEIGDDKLKTFKLGMCAFQTGISFLDKTDLRQEAHPFLEQMMEETNETVFLVTESKGQVIYLDKVESRGSIKTSSTLGSSHLMHSTGVGKALLAAFSEDKVDKIVKQHGLPAMTEFTITSYHELLAELAISRERGFTIDNREGRLELICIAAPIYSRDDTPIAAISIASLASRIMGNCDRIQQLGMIVNSTALTISHRLGFRGVKIFP